jgi:hypothetical protein
MSGIELPFGGASVTAAPPEVPTSRRRRVETFLTELGMILNQHEMALNKVAESRMAREIAQGASPDQAREMAQRAIQFGNFAQGLEKMACDKTRRDSFERARELYIDLRIRLELADKAYAEWRKAVAELERAATHELDVAERQSRERGIGRSKTEHEEWIDLAYQALPGSGIQLLG